MHGAHAHAHAHATRARERAHSRTRLHTYQNARVDASARAYAHLPSVSCTHTPSPTRAMHAGAGARTSTRARGSVCGVLSTMAARTHAATSAASARASAAVIEGTCGPRVMVWGWLRPCARVRSRAAVWHQRRARALAGTRAFRRHRARSPRAPHVGDGRSALYVRAGRHRALHALRAAAGGRLRLPRDLAAAAAPGGGRHRARARKREGRGR